MTKPYFPLFFTVEGKKCVVVGGEKKAAVAARNLINSGASVTVFTTTPPGEELARLQKGDLVEIVEREPESDDLFGVTLLLALSENPFLDDRVTNLARMEGVLCGVGHGSEGGDFVIGPVLRRGMMVFSCSTSGISGIMDESLRSEMEKTFGEEYRKYTDLLLRMKVIIDKSFEDIREKENIFERLVEANLLEMIRSGDPEKAERTALKIVATSTRKI